MSQDNPDIMYMLGKIDTSLTMLNAKMDSHISNDENFQEKIGTRVSALEANGNMKLGRASVISTVIAAIVAFVVGMVSK